MRRQPIAMQAPKNLRARLVVAVVGIAAVMWLANQQSKAGETTRTVLSGLADAFGALVTLLLTIVN